MEKCEENILSDILNKFQKNNLYDLKGNKIQNTIQALKFAISIIQSECKIQSSCAKDREPQITDKGYECPEEFIIQKNRKGENCCYKDKKNKQSKKKTEKIKISKKSSKNNSLENTNTFSKNHNLSYIENIISTTNLTQTLGFLGRKIDVITFQDIEKHIENVSDEITKEKIDKWHLDKKNIKIYDTVTINNNRGKGEFLVYFHNKQLALLNFSSNDGLVYPIECIDLINKKKNFYQEIYRYDLTKSITKSIDFFLKGDTRKDYHFFIPFPYSDLKNIKDIANIKIENKIINNNEYQFKGLFLIDIDNSDSENKLEIIIIDTNELQEFIPKSITISIDNQNFDDLKKNLNIDII